MREIVGKLRIRWEYQVINPFKQTLLKEYKTRWWLFMYKQYKYNKHTTPLITVYLMSSLYTINIFKKKRNKKRLQVHSKICIINAKKGVINQKISLTNMPDRSYCFIYVECLPLLINKSFYEVKTSLHLW